MSGVDVEMQFSWSSTLGPRLSAMDQSVPRNFWEGRGTWRKQAITDSVPRRPYTHSRRSGEGKEKEKGGGKVTGFD